MIPVTMLQSLVIDFSDNRYLCEIIAFRCLVAGAISGLGDFRNYSEWYDYLSKLIFISIYNYNLIIVK